MTNSEASVIIGNMAIDATDTCYSIEEYQEAKAMAIDALEKQIDKKPIKVDSGVYDYPFDFECPNCRENVDEDEHHCECGQKLCWD